jgi:DNA-directed RNA polymerase subunit beta'
MSADHRCWPRSSRRSANAYPGPCAAEDVKIRRPTNLVAVANTYIDEDRGRNDRGSRCPVVKVRSPLTCETKNGLCPVLRPRPGTRYAGQPRRGCRRHRSSVDRRAWYAAHHAYLPHRRCGSGGRPVVPSKPASKARSGSRMPQLVNRKDKTDHRRWAACMAGDRRREGYPNRSVTLTYGTRLMINDGDKVTRARCWQSGIRTRPIMTEVKGESSKIVDVIDGVSVSEETDESTGISNARHHRLAFCDRVSRHQAVGPSIVKARMATRSSCRTGRTQFTFSRWTPSCRLNRWRQDQAG